MVFLVGYVVAALALVVVGALHDGFGGFRVPFGVRTLVAFGQLRDGDALGPRPSLTVASPPDARAAGVGA